MSARYYCDVCEKELARFEHSRLKLKLGKVAVEVIHSLDGTCNAGHVCHACIAKVIAKGKPVDRVLTGV